MRVTILSFSRLVTGDVYSTSASPLTGGVNFLPASTGSSLVPGAPMPTPNAAANVVAAIATRARFIRSSPIQNPANVSRKTARDYIAPILHFAVPIFRLRINRSEDFHMPFAASPGLNHLGGNHV